MKDLLIKVKEIKDWSERATARPNDSVDSPRFNDVAGDADICIKCEVPGGCDDTHALCELRRIRKIHADGSALKASELASMKTEMRRQAWAKHHNLHPLAQSFDEDGQGVLL